MNEKFIFLLEGKQIQGTRSRQEDSFLLIPSDTTNESDLLDATEVISILSDGMGGHSGGNLASQEIVKTLATSIISQAKGKNLSQALIDANAAIRNLKDLKLVGDDAGATLICLYIKGDQYSWVSVGDSLLYLFRDGKLYSLNFKHTWNNVLQRQIKQGLATPKQLEDCTTPQALYTAVCGDPLRLGHPDDIDESKSYVLKPGDRFIIASDGLNTIKEELESILQKEQIAQYTPEQVCSFLLKLVEEQKRPNQDNTTVIVIDVLKRLEWFRRQYGPIDCSACHISDQGDRDSQQDACTFRQSERALLAVVADGAGGHQGGAEAAQRAVRMMEELWESKLQHNVPPSEAVKLLRVRLQSIHDNILESGHNNPDLCGKCAIVILYACQGKYVCLNAGDCRLYHNDGQKWKRITQDDSLAWKLMLMGQIKEEELKGHPDQSHLTQALGGDRAPVPHINSGRWKPGDQFLLCCDGLWNQLPDELWPVQQWTPHATQTLQKMVKASVRAKRGESDNVTAIWINSVGETSPATAQPSASSGNVFKSLVQRCHSLFRSVLRKG